MEKKCVVPLKEAITGTLYGGKGTFRILIDEEMSGIDGTVPLASLSA